MANLDLMSYERDSRWMPHLSWAYPDLSLQQQMKQQAAQREQAWQKIADKLGPLLLGSDIGGSYEQSYYISGDHSEDQDYLDRAYEKAPLLSSAKYPSSATTMSQKMISNSGSGAKNANFNNNNNNNNNNNLISHHHHQQDQQGAISQHNSHHQTCNKKNNQQHSSQKHNNLNLYAQHHHIQLPQRGLNHTSKQNSYHHNSRSQLYVLLPVLLFMLLLLLFSLLFYFFYSNN
jgi:hypothetical protein